MTNYVLVFKVVVGKQVTQVVKKVDVQEYFNEEGFFNEKKYWKLIEVFNKDIKNTAAKKSN
jgi:hypothetical protein